MPRKDPITGQISAQAQQDLVSEGIENFELPKTVVTKIAKSALPDNAKLQKETILSLVKGSTVFINYLAATAHDVAQSKQHKSISASDVLRALELLEFGDLVETLQSELQVYRELAKTDKSKKGSANLASAQASTSASAPPTVTKKGGSGTGTGSVSANQQQSQQSATAPVKSTLKARIKKPKDAASASAQEVNQQHADRDDAAPESSVSEQHVENDGDGDSGDETVSDVEEHVEDDDGEGDSGEGISDEEQKDEQDRDQPGDMMQVEEEELRNDSRGVEERDGD
ncbi:hypothetical protein AMATHDRAFT_82300 [Amanita thiersii Skay4041]|uniref:DNA polymerase epsilon subunit D n=1 Tax=Amanita thiersii Skay4041 TaxID=703135 RepID=A0A2A9NFV7_9AGAR|nr:hypothetical protein AMATHDRAFT_82300 [Amanita thiersii Skay4041]